MTTHGHARNRTTTSEYRSWTAMKDRCERSGNTQWADYGGRGITVCERWDNSFEDFLVDMGPKPTPRHQIDRIDSDGNYEPSNCRWVTARANANNKRNNSHLEFGGERLTYAEWGQRLGVSGSTIFTRIHKLGWTVERALTTATQAKREGPRRDRLIEWNGQAKTMTEWSATSGISRKLLSNRITVHGWSAERALTTPARQKKE